MATVRVRKVESAEDTNRFWEVMRRTYRGDQPPSETDLNAKPGQDRYLASDGDDVFGAYVVLDTEAWIRGERFRNAAVAAVAVQPEARAGGLGTDMLRAMLADLVSSGYAVSSLYPFREPFYAKVGYATVGKRIRVTCPAHRLPNPAAELSVRLIRPADWSSIDPCYTAFAHARSGLFARTEAQWKRVLAENRELAIYTAGDPVEAYAVVSHNGSFWSVDHVSEFIWSSARGYRSILRFLRGLAINKHGLSWYEPSDGPFPSHYLDEGVELKLERPWMSRVLRPDVIAERFGVSFSVTDAELDSNNREFGGSAPQFRCAQPALAQLIHGEPSLAQLEWLGTVEVLDPSVRNRFGPCPSYCPDFY
ncbi:MAG: GNAT family N-acetyltransferase [Fimbriimonadaceae bacterium]|nr:GNAT family N-acetyltransferase [Fimbriimonadaceae bacterium]